MEEAIEIAERAEGYARPDPRGERPDNAEICQAFAVPENPGVMAFVMLMIRRPLLLDFLQDPDRDEPIESIPEYS